MVWNSRGAGRIYRGVCPSTGVLRIRWRQPHWFSEPERTSKDTLELYVLGVLKAFHRKGVGRALFLCAKEMAIRQGYSFLQVKTVQMGKHESYDRTNRFYLSLGFKELEVFPTLWDEWNPCQIYIMGLN